MQVFTVNTFSIIISTSAHMHSSMQTNINRSKPTLTDPNQY